MPHASGIHISSHRAPCSQWKIHRHLRAAVRPRRGCAACARGAAVPASVLELARQVRCSERGLPACLPVG
eukprot:15151333-Alexandrium_andersonii.AAC.1